MNVLMLSWEFPPLITGGLGRACHGLVKALSTLGGTSVDLVLPNLNGGEDLQFARLWSLQSLERDSASNTKGFASSLARSVSSTRSAYEVSSVDPAVAFLSCARAVAEKFPDTDVIHAHDWMTFLLAIKLKDLLKCPLIVHVHSCEYDRAGLLRGNSSIERIESLGLEAADRIISVSEYTRNMIVERYSIDASKIAVVYNGAEVGHSIQSQPLLKSEVRTIVFIGRVTAQKGPLKFVRAAHRVLREQSNLQFVLAGSGDLLEESIELSRNLGIRDHFEFPGFLDDIGVKRLLARADLFIMPSLSEPFGIAALEAILANVPTILPVRSGISEVISSALKIDSSDGGSLADAMLYALKHKHEMMEMATTAREEAKFLTWSRAALQLRNAYIQLVGCDQRELS